MRLLRSWIARLRKGGRAVARTRTSRWWWVWLVPVPLVWSWAGQRGWLERFEAGTIDWRYAARKPLEAPGVKLVYVNIDSVSLDTLGNFPWNRAYFAHVCRALLEQGQVKAIGVDVVFSEKGMSASVDTERWIEGNIAWARLLFTGVPVVPAASYVAARFVDERGATVKRRLPPPGLSAAELEAVEEPELPEFRTGRGRLSHPPHVGLIDTVDGDVRWVPAFATTGVRTYFTLALELALQVWGARPEDVEITRRELIVRRPAQAGDASGQGGAAAGGIGAVATGDTPAEPVGPGMPAAADAEAVASAPREIIARVPLTDAQNLEVNWFTRWGTGAAHVPFSHVYQMADGLGAEDAAVRAKAEEFFAEFAGVVVLIGAEDTLLQDVAPTPVDPGLAPRVGMHGNLLKTLLTGRYLRRAPEWADWLIAGALAAAAAGLVTAGERLGRAARFSAALLVVLYAVAVVAAFAQLDWVLPLVVPVGAAFTTAFLAQLRQLVIEQQKRQRIKGQFASYVAPVLVERMVEMGEEPKLGGEEVEVTAYFSDIQNFSTFSEQLQAEPLVKLMNEYLTACTDVLLAERGTLDKYIGDAVVMIFGAPVALSDHAYRACLAAARVQQRQQDLRAKWRAEGEKWPLIVRGMRTRIGLNTGTAVVGNMGSPARFNYTMMGDTVNLAARMESGAKSYGAATMITEATRRACEQHGGDRLVFRPLDRIVVKGRKQPVPIFELIGLRADVTAETWECLERFERGQRLYLAQDWTEAIAEFERAALLEPLRPDRAEGMLTTPSRVFAQRCRALQAEPPGPGWDGIYVMHEK